MTGQSSYVLTSMDRIMNWARANSLWPLAFGTSCCAIEMMMSSMASRHDLSRFGAEVVRPTPRQADLLILAGTIVKRMAKPLRVLYEQMPEPRYVIATGACTISGGPFTYNSYTTVRGADEIIPVDVFVPGCPPRPEALIYGIMTLQKMIKTGEAYGQPYQRRRPITAALPPGMTQAQLQKEIAEFLEAHATIDVDKAAHNNRWEKERY
ncbi:MAG: NADH-quinone oxidoreductase subunit B [Bdellovibrionales bacterium]|nr:NADH-quinone oxidoreductase subunit B [Bdellovibrionales bacterium]